jgi:hypothetical protein
VNHTEHMDSVKKASPMKLTNYMRDAYVTAVLADTPTLNIKELNEEVHKIAIADALMSLPDAIRKCWVKNETRPYLYTKLLGFGSREFGFCFDSIYLPCCQSFALVLSAEATEKIKVIGAKAKAALDLDENLRRKLRAAAYGCNTRKQLADLMPEFVKYLPADEVTGARTQLAVANVVSDFVKAGWPKDGKK